MSLDEQKRYRISGHESFPCRYAWLPKVVRLVKSNPGVLLDDDKAMVELGLGKNMVRSARFWAHVTGVADVSRSGVVLTPFGEGVLGCRPLDPFLEDVRTLWLLHWQLSSRIDAPLLAWDVLVGRWQEPEFAPSAVVRKMLAEASGDDSLSVVTIQQHLDVFLRTYLPTRTPKGKVLEDNLDCPLVELEFLRRMGDRESPAVKGGRETVYSFRVEEKPDITAELFAYAVADFWAKRFPNERTLALKDIAHGPGSPGRVFRLPEDAVSARIETISASSSGRFTYLDSAQLQQLRRTDKPVNLQSALQNVYAGEA